jgi:hypothetical protein
MLAAPRALAHGVQVGYGVLPNGYIRIYVEHWHGDHPGLANSPLSVTTTVGSTSTTATYNAQGEVPNTAWNNLPLLGSNITILKTGPYSNTYNDWLYWDFPPGTCNQPVSITINAGLTAVTSDSGGMYPVTIQGQVFTDQGAPVITAPDITVNGSCTGANVNYSVSVADDCDKTPVVTYSQASGSFFPVGTTVVTVTATDNTGKTSVKAFNVTVISTDTTPPTLTVPQPIFAYAGANECGAHIFFTPLLSATDDCSTPTITTSHDVSYLFPVGTTTVTATATDGAGNKTVKTFTVTIVDNIAPTLSVSDITVNAAPGTCAAPVSFNATATDNCSATVTYSQASGSSFPVGTTVVTATAKDPSGNTTTKTFNVIVVDTQAPAIATNASSVTVESDGSGNTAALNAWLASNGGAVATDNCGSVTWSNNFHGLTAACGSTGSATVVFTATDAAGNATTTTATFTSVDTTAPAIGTPAASQVVACDSNSAAALSAWLANHGGAAATDASGTVTWTNNFSALSDDCGATGSATVTFTASDACGNKSTTTASFKVVDTTAPTITAAAANKTVETDGAGNTAALSAWLASNGGATATDACGSVTWSNNFSGLSDLCGATGAATVTFTATDECGNKSTTTATFSIVDTQAPTVVAASNKTVETDGSGNAAALSAWLASNGGASATDSSGSITWSNNFTSLATSCGSAGSATVTFTATDACGNSASTTATFTIVDTTAPVLTSDVANMGPNFGTGGKPQTFTITSTDVGGSSTASITKVTAYQVNAQGNILDKTEQVKFTVSGNSITITITGGVGTIWTIETSGVDACGNTATKSFVLNIVNPAKG